MAGIPGSNYINANFVDGYEKKNSYIATQAPLQHTISDFWRMVWESKCQVIVMLTNLFENRKASVLSKGLHLDNLLLFISYNNNDESINYNNN